MKGLSSNFDTIELDQAWSADVLVSCSGLDRDCAIGTHLPNADAWRAFLNAFLKDATLMPGYGLLKYSRAGEVCRVSFPLPSGECTVVCKRSRVLGLRRLWSRFRPSRERRNFDRGFALLRSGIDTALPLAVIERRGPRREAWLITEFLADVVDLDQIASRFLATLEPARRRSVKNALIEAAAGTILRFRAAGWYHRDFKASNVLVESWNVAAKRPRIFIVDTDGVRSRKPLDSWQPVVRLVASLRHHAALTRSDLARFLRGYIEQSGEPVAGWKQCFRRIDRESARYVRASLGRKSGKFDAFGGDHPA